MQIKPSPTTNPKPTFLPFASLFEGDGDSLVPLLLVLELLDKLEVVPNDLGDRVDDEESAPKSFEGNKTLST